MGEVDWSRVTCASCSWENCLPDGGLDGAGCIGLAADDDDTLGSGFVTAGSGLSESPRDAITGSRTCRTQYQPTC